MSKFIIGYLLIVLAPCWLTAQKPLKIILTDKKGHRISDAKIDITGGGEIKSDNILDKEGEYHYVKAKEGKQLTIRVYKPGYKYSVTQYTINDGDNMYDLALEENKEKIVNIVGLIEDSITSDFVLGVKVSWLGMGKYTTVQTDSFGRFDLQIRAEDVPRNGLSRLAIKKDGYKDKLCILQLYGEDYLYASILLSSNTQKLVVVPSVASIPSGEFEMGCHLGKKKCLFDSELPSHKVMLAGFYMSRYEISNAEYCRFLNAKKLSGSDANDIREWIALTDTLGTEKCRIKEGNKYTVESGYDLYPVIFVSWFGAKEYCRWLKKIDGQKWRLPTEAEWEYAARAGSKTGLFSRVENDRELQEYVNCAMPGVSQRRLAANNDDRYQANAFGLFHMSGNVHEWCDDWYSENYYNESKEAINPEGPSKQGSAKRIFRGGAWNEEESFCYVFRRAAEVPKTQSGALGFRIVRNR